MLFDDSFSEHRASAEGAAGIDYAELHCLSNFSFLRGASHPQELVYRAAELGYRAIALTDECSLAGIVKAHVAAKACGIPLIIGAEFLVEEGQRVVALVTNRTGYAELSSLITLARRRSPKGEYRLRLRDLEYNLRHNLLIWLPTHGEPGNEDCAAVLKRAFDGRLWIGVGNLLRGDEPERYEACYGLARRWGIPMVACGDAQMHSASRQPLHDALTAIRHNLPMSELGFRRHGNAERHLRSLKRLRRLYPQPLLAESAAIAARCAFSLDELRYEYPPEVVPPGTSPTAYLRFLVEAGARERWPGGVPDAIRRRIDTELALIATLEYEHYFLTVHDIVRFALDHDILCQGRGSAANSVVCYCLRITEVSPERASLLFERFLSVERKEPPDIDVDFEHEKREEVIQYIYKKYGRERAALTATVIYYRARSAIRDIGKALGLDALFVDQLSKSLAWWDSRQELEQRFESQGFARGSPVTALFFRLVREIRGFPRHLSQHVGGFLISKGPISALVPVENASMPERTVIQWDKEDIESLGLLKVDVLALGMLTAIHKCLALLALHHPGAPRRMEDIPPGDQATYAMLQQADSVGVFQVESRAQMAMLPRLRPREYYDLVVQVAIVRPGPIQGNMVHPYLRRRQGLEKVTYPNEKVKDVLKRTLGVPIFQEQVIKLAMVAADFTGGEADQLRRAMASWGKNGDLMRFRDKLLEGMRKNDYPQEFAERLFDQMKGFGAYGFPESHAASFALLVYVSAWLKCHYPAAFYCALLNSQPMGFYSPSQLVQDARRHGIAVFPVDVRYSEEAHTLEIVDGQPALRLGFCLVRGLAKNHIPALIAARRQRPFASSADLRRRAGLPAAQLECLIAAGALQGLSGHRHQAHWEAAGFEEDAPLAPASADAAEGIALPAPTEMEDLNADYNATGLTLSRHPMAVLREQVALFQRCRRQSELAALGHGRFVRIAGIVTGRQRPGTESGVIFLTLEDETGNTNVVVWTDVQRRCREALLKAKLLLVKGVVETDERVVHVISGELIDCSHYLSEMSLSSRDFH